MKIRRSLLILPKVFALCLIIWSCSEVRTTKISDVKFNDVVVFATSHFNDSLACLTNVEHNGYFNFKKLAVIDTEDSTKDRSVWICEVDGNVSTVTTSLQAASFRFKVVTNSTHNYVVLYPFYKSYEVWNAVNGFILVFNDQCYFVPFEQYPLYFMQLDSALNVVQTVRSLRFRTDSLIYKTVINYRDGNRIYSETILQLKERLAVSSTTTLDEIVNLLKNGVVTGKQMELRVGLTPEDENLPLWMESGHHEYDYDSIENNTTLPLQR